MQTMHDDRRDAWEASYERRENYVFVPAEELVRFTAKYVRRRVGLDEHRDAGPPPGTVLDLGCGVGRHLVYLHELGLDVRGIDLSGHAVSMARRWLRRAGDVDAETHVVEGSVASLPWREAQFTHVVSDSVLDSVPFETAQLAVAEVARVLTDGGLFYVSLIGPDTAHGNRFAGEEEVTTEHERGTVQSYFTAEKVTALLEGRFELVELVCVRRDEHPSGWSTSRWHAVARRRAVR